MGKAAYKSNDNDYKYDTLQGIGKLTKSNR